MGLVCVALVLAACSRSSSKGEPRPANAKPSATASGGAGKSKRAGSALASQPRPAPVTPKIPPQIIACGEREFYRITRSALQVFEIAKELPPPNIRGSRVAVQTNEVPVAEPSNVFSTAKKSALVIAKGGVFRYELGQNQVRRYPPIRASAPLVAWPDPARADYFRVRGAGEESVREFALARASSADAGSPPAPAESARRVQALPNFDQRFFTVLADGSALYSTPQGLVRHGRAPRSTPPAELSAQATMLFADSSPDRYWTVDASGRLALFDPNRGASPTFTSSVPGVVIDTAVESEKVAVLGMELDAEGYRPTVTIFSNGEELARLAIGASMTRTPPELDVCLIAGLPWVLVGSARWMQLIDTESGRLLAEW